MKIKITAIALLIGFLAFVVYATTQDQAITAASGYLSLSEHALNSVEAYYLAGAVSSTIAISNAIPYSSLDEHSLSAIRAYYAANSSSSSTITNVYEFCLSDETTAITTGTAKVSWRAPHAMTLKDCRASLSTASSSGIPTVNIKESGTTIFSTKLTIDANETTSTTAATPYAFSDTSIADDALITFDIDVAGTGAAGLKVKLYYTR